MQKSKQIFSVGQQNRFQQLQLEVAALEEQVKNSLKEQADLTSLNTHQPIPINYVNDRVAKSGIRLTHETAY